MSKIKDIINDNNSILVFDIDGVLATIEYGEYNHYSLNDDEWDKLVRSGKSFYNETEVIDTMKKYLSKHNMDNVYVCSKVMNEKEFNMKKDFAMKYYNIKENNIFYVYKNEDKLNILKKINLKYNTEEHNIALVDDTVDILTYVMNNSNFATIHISSFM